MFSVRQVSSKLCRSFVKRDGAGVDDRSLSEGKHRSGVTSISGMSRRCSWSIGRPPEPLTFVPPSGDSATRSWLTLLLLALAMAVSFLDRYALAMLVQPIKADLALSDSAIGLLAPTFGLQSLRYALLIVIALGSVAMSVHAVLLVRAMRWVA